MKKTVMIVMIGILFLAGCANLRQSVCPAPLEDFTAVVAPTGRAFVDLPSTTDLKELPRKTVTEGDLVEFPNLKAVDPDGDPINYEYSAPLDTSGKWQTVVGDAGLYKVTITALDGNNRAEQLVVVEVLTANRAPLLVVPDSITVNEGETLTIPAKVSDPDNDEVRVIFGGFTSAAQKTIGFNESGTHKVTITATDGSRTVEKIITIVVVDVNRPPILGPLLDRTVNEREVVDIRPSSADADGDSVSFSFSSPFNSDGVWESAKPGTYQVSVTASDGQSSVQKTFTLLVRSTNKPPVISGLKNIEIREGETLTLNPVVTDPEGDIVSIEYSGFMSAPSKTIGFNEAGEHKVTITATDAINKVSTTITITVLDVNRAPVFDPGAFN